MVAADSSTQATLGTVSSPLELAPQGEHTSVSISGGKRKAVKPAVKVTLTSLTPNNVRITVELERPCLSFWSHWVHFSESRVLQG